ncbi:MAG: HD domain-containing protein [Candidatus Saccharibacteria bacterium]|nr:HD domain-containing protein [Candidatus Saccharibacteria bacterium]
MKRAEILKLIDELEFLFKQYSNELRATTQPYYLAQTRKRLKNYTYDPADVLVREKLIEHVGSLPIVAAALFPYIDDPSVDLGQALAMLAIHDIGEVIVGDEITFTKQSASKQSEADAALSLLHSSYHAMYHEVENQTSPTARFAKSIDKITPDIFDYLTPADITIQRFKYYVGIDKDQIMDLLLKHKRPYMLWNPFMTEFHKVLYEKLAKKLAS